MLVLAAPLLDFAGVLKPGAALDRPVGHTLGFVLFFTRLVGTLLAQAMMGSSWSVGVDEDERTKLITTGPFALVRNPIFSAMILAFLGLALLFPNAAALTGLVALVVAIEIQVRLVEKPYLLRAHDARYAAYASWVGRFVPGIGLLKGGRIR